MQSLPNHKHLNIVNVALKCRADPFCASSSIFDSPHSTVALVERTSTSCLINEASIRTKYHPAANYPQTTNLIFPACKSCQTHPSSYQMSSQTRPISFNSQPIESLTRTCAQSIAARKKEIHMKIQTPSNPKPNFAN